MNVCFSSVMLCICLAFVLNASGQELDRIELHEISTTDRRELDRVNELLKAKQYDDAFDAVQRLLIRSGSRLVPVVEENGFQYHVSLADVVHAQLAGTKGTAALDRYRDRYEAVASKLTKEARDRVDLAKMEQVSRDYPLTPSGTFATHWLAEHALSMGRYHLARWWWERLAPIERKVVTGPGGIRFHRVAADSTSQTTSRLHHYLPRSRYVSELPSNPIACQVLTSILSRDFLRAEIELQYLDRTAPSAVGELAGRQGSWRDLLREQLDAVRTQRDVNADSSEAPFLDLPLAAAWTHKLPTRHGMNDLIGFGRSRVAEPGSALRGYYPAADENAVYVNELGRIRAFKLSDGAAFFATGREESPGTIYRWASPWKHDGNDMKLGVPRSSVVIANQRLFARMGDPVTVPKRVPQPTAEPPTGIIGLDLSRGARMLDGFPLRPDDHQWTFDGPPLVIDDRLYCVMRKRDSVQASMFVACFDINAGDLVWRRSIASSTPWGKNRWHQITNNSLSHDAGMLFLNSNVGVIVGIRARDGGLLWATKYPRSAFTAGDPHNTGRHYFRDTCPCLLYKGLVICAPTDSPSIFALDATTGTLVWKTPNGRAEDVVHLYGVTNVGQLVASGDFAYWIDARQGTITKQFPNIGITRTSRALPAPHGVGRGVLLPGGFVWPTRDYIYCFAETKQSHTGERFRRIPLKHRRAQSGNLMVRSNAVILTTGDSLSVFFLPYNDGTQ